MFDRGREPMLEALNNGVLKRSSNPSEVLSAMRPASPFSPRNTLFLPKNE